MPSRYFSAYLFINHAGSLSLFLYNSFCIVPLYFCSPSFIEQNTKRLVAIFCFRALCDFAFVFTRALFWGINLRMRTRLTFLSETKQGLNEIYFHPVTPPNSAPGVSIFVDGKWTFGVLKIRRRHDK